MKKFTLNPKTGNYEEVLDLNEPMTADEYKKLRKNRKVRSIAKKANSIKLKAKKVLIGTGLTMLGITLLTSMANSSGPDYTGQINRLRSENFRLDQQLIEVKTEWATANALREEGELELQSAQMKIGDAMAAMSVTENQAQEIRNAQLDNNNQIESLMNEMAGLTRDQK